MRFSKSNFILMKSRITSVNNEIYFDYLKCKLISEVQCMAEVTMQAIMKGQRSQVFIKQLKIKFIFSYYIFQRGTVRKRTSQNHFFFIKLFLLQKVLNKDTAYNRNKKNFGSRKTNLKFWHSNYFSLGKFLNFSESQFSYL